MNARTAIAQRGLTLTEVTVVIVIASVVMAGMVAFYLNSQGTWMDASSQAIAQREATLAIATIRDRVMGADSAVVTFNPDAAHASLAILRPNAPAESTFFFWWNGDSLLHSGYRNAGEDRGPVVASTVEIFRARAAGRMVSIDTLTIRSAMGERISIGTRILMRNHP